MNEPVTNSRASLPYEIEPKNKFLAAVASITEYEIRRPGTTVTFLSEVDLSEVEQVRQRAAREGGRKPSYTAFVIKAVSLALRQYPYANRRYVSLPFRGARAQKFNRIDAAVLCERQLPDAPMVAFVDMIRDADQLSLEAITEQLRALTTCDTSTNEQWASFTRIINRLPTWLARWVIRVPVFFPGLWVRYRGGAFVVSSPAKYGVDMIAAAWPWPLGVSFGLVKERPVVRQGTVVARPTFVLTLNWDRRVMAGAQAGHFFKRITDCLEHAAAELASPEPAGPGPPVAEPDSPADGRRLFSDSSRRQNEQLGEVGGGAAGD